MRGEQKERRTNGGFSEKRRGICRVGEKVLKEHGSGGDCKNKKFKSWEHKPFRDSDCK